MPRPIHQILRVVKETLAGFTSRQVLVAGKVNRNLDKEGRSLSWYIRVLGSSLQVNQHLVLVFRTFGLPGTPSPHSVSYSEVFTQLRGRAKCPRADGTKI